MINVQIPYEIRKFLVLRPYVIFFSLFRSSLFTLEVSYGASINQTRAQIGFPNSKTEKLFTDFVKTPKSYKKP